MTQLSKSNIVLFPSARTSAAVAKRGATPQDTLRLRWHVSPTSGKLACVWLPANADDPGIPYSLAS